MFTAQTVAVTGASAVKLTSGINVDQSLVLVIKVEQPETGTVYGVWIGDSGVAVGSGYFLAAVPESEGTSEAKITVRVQGDDVYAIANTSGTVNVDVLAYSAC